MIRSEKRDLLRLAFGAIEILCGGESPIGPLEQLERGIELNCFRTMELYLDFLKKLKSSGIRSTLKSKLLLESHFVVLLLDDSLLWLKSSGAFPFSEQTGSRVTRPSLN